MTDKKNQEYDIDYEIAKVFYIYNNLAPKPPQAPLDDDKERLYSTLYKRLARLVGGDVRRQQTNSWRLDRAAFDEIFPIGALPEPIQAILKALGKKYGVPYGASLASMLTASSGFLGYHKARILKSPLDPLDFIAPMIHSILIGDSADGKTRITEFFFERIRRHSAKANDWIKKQQLLEQDLRKELDELAANPERSDADKGRIIYLRQVLRLLGIGGRAKYIVRWKSPESMIDQLYRNELYAKVIGGVQSGLILKMHETSRIFTRGQTNKDASDASELWGDLCEIGDGNLDQADAVGRKTPGDADGGAVAYAFEAQTESLTCFLSSILKVKGLLNRLLFAYCPTNEDDDEEEDDDVIIIQERSTWEKIVDYIAGLGFSNYFCRCEALSSYKKELRRLAKQASKDGDAPKKAYSRKLCYIVYQIALELHIWGLALNDDIRDDAETVELDGVTVPQWAVIPESTIRAAIALCEYYRKTRDIIWSIVISAVSSQKATRDNLNDDAEEKPLPAKVDALYRWIFATHTDKDTGVIVNNATPYDLLRHGDGLGRVISISALRTKNFYKNPTTRQIFKRELEARALMFRLPPRGGNDQGALIFISNDLKLEDLEHWFQAVGLSRALSVYRENKRKQPRAE